VRKVLVANRGEIAVRVIRACKDSNLDSVAVYADGDRDALHVQLADEAFALGGRTAAETYLDIGKLVEACRRSGADAVHPGYGFLAENADFAEAVLAAGLTWIGPPPAAVRALGDKVRARHIAADVGAPLTAGTSDPVSGVPEVLEFIDRHGTPIAIKAAFGGGGRGLKVAWDRESAAELYDSAVREALAAFGRGECFVERYLDRPRHVETQVLADEHGRIIIAGTRDCSLQRRYQKLVEEAPAPFLEEEQRQALYEASRSIARAAGYVGAGTCEFLVGQDGTISFLEVNTRLQVEHPVTEETTGLDLVREQFRIADGQHLPDGDPAPRGHAFEFRINGEDPGRNFLPTPGPVTGWRPAAGPGVRVDAGVTAGSVIGQEFDSLLAKLIVFGADRRQALERSRRALDEFVVDGLPTVLPFHRAVVRDPAFTDEPFRVHNRWIETEFAAELAPQPAGADLPEPAEREVVVVEVDGRRLEVALPADLSARGRTRSGPPPRRRAGAAAGAAGGDTLVTPMQGTIVKVAVTEGQAVSAGDLVVVLEAMKMEQPLNAHRAGTVHDLSATVGAVVTSGSVICRITD
jgi:acetyl-CoA/propionyl-CoA carboxylase biotin carboxyl carrier protein